MTALACGNEAAVNQSLKQSPFFSLLYTYKKENTVF